MTMMIDDDDIEIIIFSQCFQEELIS